MRAWRHIFCVIFLSLLLAPASSWCAAGIKRSGAEGVKTTTKKQCVEDLTSKRQPECAPLFSKLASIEEASGRISQILENVTQQLHEEEEKTTKFTDLPYDILTEIFRTLDDSDRESLGKTCSLFRDIHKTAPWKWIGGFFSEEETSVEEIDMFFQKYKMRGNKVSLHSLPPRFVDKRFRLLPMTKALSMSELSLEAQLSVLKSSTKLQQVTLDLVPARKAETVTDLAHHLCKLDDLRKLKVASFLGATRPHEMLALVPSLCFKKQGIISLLPRLRKLSFEGYHLGKNKASAIVNFLDRKTADIAFPRTRTLVHRLQEALQTDVDLLVEEGLWVGAVGYDTWLAATLGRLLCEAPNVQTFKLEDCRSHLRSVVPALQLALFHGACENLASLTLSDSLRGRISANTNHIVKLFVLVLQAWRNSLKHLDVSNNRCVSKISPSNIKHLIHTDKKKRRETSCVSLLESLNVSMDSDAQCRNDVMVQGWTDFISCCFPRLQELNIKGCHWPDKHIPSVLEMISNLPDLKTLNLKDNRFTPTEKSRLHIKLGIYHPKLTALLD